MNALQQLPPSIQSYVNFILPDGFELVDGQLQETQTMSEKSAWIGGEILVQLSIHCKESKAGRVYPGDTAFRCFPGQKPSIRKPDVAFVRQERLPHLPGDRDLTIVPDLVVEVISPNETVYELDGKIEQFLSVGTSLIWVVNPRTRVVIVHRLDGSMTKLRDTQELDGEMVLPGFRCRIAEILPEPEPIIEVAEAEATPEEIN